MSNYSRYEELADGSEIGRVALYTPEDWFDLLADGEDTAAIHRRFQELIDHSYPHESSHVRRNFTDALLYWRTSMLRQGIIAQGVVAVPEDNENGPATWQINVGVVDVPSTSDDLNITAVMERQLASELQDRDVYLESFPTEIGLGFGVISQPRFSPDSTFDAFPPLRDPSTSALQSPERLRIGQAVVLATPPGGGLGLLVIGHCLDPEQVLPLAAVVAIIGGKSHFIDGLDLDKE